MAIGTSITNFAAQAADQELMIHNFSLARGARNGSLNREEFLELNSESNGMTQLRDTFSKDGTTPEEQQLLDARQLAYMSKLDQYRNGDFKPAVPSSNPYDKAQNEQAGNIYDGIREGNVDLSEANRLLTMQRDMAKGSLERKPTEQQRLLNTSEFEIQQARKDKTTAQAPPDPLSPPSFPPNPFPFPTLPSAYPGSPWPSQSKMIP